MEMIKMNASSKERDVSIELVRIIACLIIVGVHTLLSAQINGSYSNRRIFLSCLFADGVAIFWMISGCFLFQNFKQKTF